MTQESDTQKLRKQISEQMAQGDFTGWFETLYAGANQNADIIPWAHATVHPLLTEWLDTHSIDGTGKRTLVLGSALGDDAEKLADLGFSVTAFDISPSAIAWSKQRFPDTTVDYQVADLFNLPIEWRGQFDFVLEIFTVQALPVNIRTDALRAIPALLNTEGQLLFVCLGREHDDIPQGPPWAISREELKTLEDDGLHIIDAEDFLQHNTARRFRILYGK